MRRVRKGFSGRVTPLFPTMVVQSELVKGSVMPTDPYHTPIILQSSSIQPQKTHKPRKPTRKVTQVPQPSDLMEHVADEAVYKELGDSLVKAATTTSSLEAEQDSCNINKTQLKATPNESSSQETDSSGGPRVESLDDEESMGKDVSKHGRIEAINADEDITLVNDQDDVDMFDVNDLGGKEVFVAEQEVVKDVNKNVVEEVVNAAQDSTATTTITTEELTLAQALEALKTSKPKVKGIVIQEHEEPGKLTTIATIPKQQSQDKGKGIMLKEPMKPKKKDQIRLGEEAAKRLQAEFNKEERLAREREFKKNKKPILP
nr:hypothetical protein [Tanacetum cinerariifolium]